MGYIQINTISLQPVPTTATTVLIWYRLTSAPDVPASYTSVPPPIVVPVGGVLTTPFIIDELSDATSYTVVVKSDCGNYSVQAVFTTGTVCPTIISVDTNDLIAYWGWKSSAVVLSDYEIQYSPYYQYITATQNIECTYAGGSATPQYLWMAEPLAASQKTKWEDKIEPYNNGRIGTDQDLFSLPTITPKFRFYITMYPTQQSNNLIYNVA